MSTTIITYNINGIRAAQRKGVNDWLAQKDFDIICLQEIKARAEQVDLEPLRELGYHIYWHAAERKGYSGVATLSKIEPEQVVEGCGIDKYDAEGRILRTDYPDWTLLNCYFPSGTTGDERQTFKMGFLDDFFDWIENLRKEHPNLMVVGDYNIAHTEMDIHDPVRNKKSSGFLPEERKWLTRWFDSGFTDAFRHLHPDKVSYSWWSYRARAREKDKGWRLDYQSIAAPLKDRLKKACQLQDAKHSDHCPVFVELEL